MILSFAISNLSRKMNLKTQGMSRLRFFELKAAKKVDLFGKNWLGSIELDLNRGVNPFGPIRRQDT